MKKRFLSAALALAMMLTMLPMTVLPVFAAGDPGTDVYYYAANAKFQSPEEGTTDTASSGGWYTRTKTDGKNTYRYGSAASSGVISGLNPTPNNGATAKLYTDINTAVTAVASDGGGKSQVTLLSDQTLNVSAVSVSTLQVNINGQALDVTGNTTGDAPVAPATNASRSFGTLTVTNSAYPTSAGSLDLNSTEINGKNFILNVTNVGDTSSAGSGTITLDNNDTDAHKKLSNTLTVNVTNSAIGSIVTEGAKGSVKVNAGYTGGITLGAASGQDLSKTGGSVTVENRSTVGNTGIYGTGSVTMSGLSNMGALTVYGGTKAQNSNRAVTAKTTATITNSTVASIAQAATDEAGHSITLQNRSNVTSTISLLGQGANTVKISESTASAAVSMVQGKLDITNSDVASITAAANGSVTGGLAITVGTRNQADTSKVGDLTHASGAATTSLVVNGGEVGAIGSDLAGFSVEVWGGTVGNSIPKASLKGGLASGYEVFDDSDDTYTYTTKFQDLIDIYKIVGDTDFSAYRVGDRELDGTTPNITVTFAWNIDNTAAHETLTKVKMSAGTFKLPDMVNGTRVDYWHDVNDQDTTTEGIAANTNYPISAPTTLTVQLDPDTRHAVTAVYATDAKGSDVPITCAVNTTTINLSGAVNTTVTAGNITLTFEVDGEVGSPALTATVTWNTDGTIQVTGTSATNGVTIPVVRGNQVKVYDTTYTITANGLKEKVANVNIGTLTGVPVSVPSATAGMTRPYDVLGQELRKTLLEGNNSEVDFSAATGIQAALNALIANQTESSANSMITQARNAMAAADNKAKVDGDTTHKGTDAKYLGYNQVELLPYLEVSASNPGSNQGTTNDPTLVITMNLKYRYRVTDGANYAYKETDATNSAASLVDWEQTGALNVKGTDCGPVTIALEMPDELTFADSTTTSFAHHEGYVYGIEWDSQVGTFTNYNGFSPFNINSTPGAVSIDGVSAYSFNNLQTAVDAVKNNQTINVNMDYNGSISVTGAARNFDIKATDGHTVTLTGVNGASTTYKFDEASNTYDVMLAAQTTGATADIKVNAASYGVATANTNRATVGSTVTITTVPNTGYRTQSVTAVTNTGANVAVSNPSANTYTFVVPTNATSVTVTPTFVVDQGLPFTDVRTTDSFYSAVRYCYEHSLIQGTTSTSFAPYGAITRAQIVTILWRQAGAQRQTATGLFSDMPGDTDMYNAVIWAANLGIAKGYEDGKFYPARAINRQELATFLYRYETLYLKKTPTGSVSSLNNYNGYTYVGSWAQNEMRWAVGNNILPNAATNLAPTENAPRWQAAMAMQQYCQNVLGIK